MIKKGINHIIGDTSTINGIKKIIPTKAFLEVVKNKHIVTIIKKNKDINLLMFFFVEFKNRDKQKGQMMQNHVPA
tara:strand:+ start:1879 stop:2103 length:225 start_codon:yes stop_codon:yes gene_type:complete